MTTVSFAQAVICCTPIVGPIVSSLYMSAQLEDGRVRGAVGAKLLNARIYAIYGVIGSVLSIVTTVALIALGVFALAPGIIIAIVYVATACVYLYCVKKISDAFPLPVLSAIINATCPTSPT